MMVPFLDVKKSVLGKCWKLRSYDDMLGLTLSQSLNIPEILCRLLAARGFGVSAAQDYLSPSLKKVLPDPSTFKDMDLATARLIKAIHNCEKIAVLGDYDVDGATSSALLARFFAQLGIKVRIYIPDRIEEGYGPNCGAFELLKQEGISVVITVDCGTTSHEPLQFAADLGLDIIVVDHHAAEPKLPLAVALINPNRLDETNSFKSLAAVGLCFLLVVALNRALRLAGSYNSHPEPDLLNLLDLVALGTVCDVMPLTGLNRAYVAQGLKVLAQRQNRGLKALYDVSGICEHPSAYHLGFILGPRINAGGRVGQADLGARLLCSENPVETREIAVVLDQLNQQRKEIEQQVLEQAMALAEKQETPFIMVAGEGWHPGVIGIVASRLKERFNRPACVIAIDQDGVGKGSGRSVTGLDLGAMVHAARQTGLLVAGGGHAMAAGFTVKAEMILALHQFLIERMKCFELELAPTLHVDALLTIEAATVEFVKCIEQMAPFGMGNALPRFGFRELQLARADIVGEAHIRCVFVQRDGKRLQGIAFRAIGTALETVLLENKGAFLNVVGSLRLDSWQGQEKIQLTIEDVSRAFTNLNAVA
jgi:single-stranded-DNA-specific exonuclease